MSVSRFAMLSLTAALLIAGTSAMGGDNPPSDLELLTRWMTGSFSSASQAAEDPEFFDIRLHMARIWPDRDDGHWLYVEQAVASSQDKPYRQRVYHLTQVSGNLFQSQVYGFEEPLKLAGAWRSERPLELLSPADLTEREGCAILMRRRGDEYIGSTLGSLCTSRLRGATYATSEVTIRAGELVSWDRGFDADGKQVWGATKGGYVFRREDTTKTD